MTTNLLITMIGFSITPLLSFCQTFDLKASIDRGKPVYETYCSSCHMAGGEGLEGAFPPVAKSDYLNDKNRLVKVVLLGLRGPIKVNGVDYNGEKTGYNLTDQEVSDLLNYVRNTWGNKGAPILPKEIQPALKTKSKDFQAY